MFLLLVACGLLYMLMGELTDALMLLGFVFVVMGITIVQERRTERALEALKDLSSPRALVIRDGQQKRIAGRDVVRGDIVLVAEGDRVPADAVLLQGINLSVDESLAHRRIGAGAQGCPPTDSTEMGPPGGDDLPFLFSGTLVTGGQGVAEVQRTGMRTELGKIGKAIHGIESEADAPAEGDGQAGPLPGRRRPGALRGCRRGLCPQPRQLGGLLGGGLPGRNHHGDGDAARGTPRGADDLPGAGGVADFAAAGS